MLPVELDVSLAQVSWPLVTRLGMLFWPGFGKMCFPLSVEMMVRSGGSLDLPKFSSSDWKEISRVKSFFVLVVCRVLQLLTVSHAEGER